MSAGRSADAVDVIAYSGYRGEQEPRAVVLDGERQPVKEIKRRWRSPDGSYFDVELAGGRRLILRQGGEDLGWSLVER